MHSNLYRNVRGVIPASLLIGVVWGVWHLPLWIMPGETHGAYPFLAFALETTSSSVLYALLYNASGQKLIVPWLYHTMHNWAPSLFPYLHMIPGKPETAFWLYAGVNVVVGLVAAYIIWRRGDRLEQGRKTFRPASLSS